MLLTKYISVHALVDVPACDPVADCNGRGICTDRSRLLCECDLGWTGDDCSIPVKYCTPSSCMNRGTCIENPNREEDPNVPGRLLFATICDCDTATGFTGQPYLGEFCEVPPPCDSHPCLNGGECTPNGNGYVCNCSSTASPYSANPFIGLHCEISQTEPCEMNPCHNDAACTDGGPGSDTWACNCADGWHGLRCEIPPTDRCNLPANAQVCGVHGVCLPDPSVNSRPVPFLRCVCMDGWGGETCSQEPNACTGRCQNGGVCIHDALLLSPEADSDAFACICPHPYVGTYCQWNVTEWGTASTSSVGLFSTVLLALVALMF